MKYWSIDKEIILCVSKNSWFLRYAIDLSDLLKKRGFQSYVMYSPDLEKIKNNIVFYLSYPKIVKKTFIKASYESIVVHASNLPQGKGMSPWVWQILEGKNKIPLTLFQMEETLDSGDIYLQSEIHLEGHELINEIRDELSISIRNIILEFLCSENKPVFKKQEGKESFYRKRTPEDNRVKLTDKIEDIFNLLRVSDNDKYPCFFDHMNNRYLLKIEKEK